MIFLNKYNNPINIRFDMFKQTIEKCIERDLKIFVETGTSRGKKKFFFFNKINWKDGMSTLIFAEFAAFVNGELHSCDVSYKNINSAKSFIRKYKKNVTFHIQDSTLFLKDFKKKIDLLYLDSLDGHDPIKSSQHQLLEIENSIQKLHDKSLVLLDDKGKKTNLSIPFLLKNGFIPLVETDHQVLFCKK
jgi:hypothetical protein|tara:strand:- start:6126 stop:6692 length:567 start_codon:yes stop_codon:yes gene_type:complete